MTISRRVPRRAVFRRRFNKNGSISLLCGGRVVCKTRDASQIATFIEGFREAEASRGARLTR